MCSLSLSHFDRSCYAQPYVVRPFFAHKFFQVHRYGIRRTVREIMTKRGEYDKEFSLPISRVRAILHTAATTRRRLTCNFDFFPLSLALAIWNAKKRNSFTSHAQSASLTHRTCCVRRTCVCTNTPRYSLLSLSRLSFALLPMYMICAVQLRAPNSTTNMPISNVYCARDLHANF